MENVAAVSCGCHGSSPHSDVWATQLALLAETVVYFDPMSNYFASVFSVLVLILFVL